MIFKDALPCAEHYTGTVQNITMVPTALKENIEF